MKTKALKALAFVSPFMFLGGNASCMAVNYFYTAEFHLDYIDTYPVTLPLPLPSPSTSFSGDTAFQTTVYAVQKVAYEVPGLIQYDDERERVSSVTVRIDGYDVPYTETSTQMFVYSGISLFGSWVESGNPTTTLGIFHGYVAYYTPHISAIPEPKAYLTMMLGILSLGYWMRRKISL